MIQRGGETDGSATSDVSPRRRFRVRAWHVLAVVVLCGVACVLWLRGHWLGEFQRRIDAIHAAGYPATPAELDAWYKWPQSGSNAAHWIIGAGTLYVEPPKDDWARLQQILFRHGSERVDPNQPLVADLANLRDLLEKYVQANSTSLQSLYDGATVTECRYPVEFSERGTASMSHISHVRNGVLLLCLEAVLRAEQGDAQHAAEAIETAIHVADTLNGEPVMISHLVAIFGAGTASVSLERILNRVEFTDAQLAALSQAFQEFSGHTEPLKALVGDRCLQYPLFDNPQGVDPSSYGGKPKPLSNDGAKNDAWDVVFRVQR